jgi:hypothetical protein
MSVETILQQIEVEIEKLSSVRALLAGGNGIGVKIAPANAKKAFSTSARRKMAAAQKMRWAAFHASKDQAPKGKLSVIQPKRMSPAARKKIAAAQRARWAKLKAAGKKAA